ncbi:phenylacetate--CoA ligase family protein [Marinobacter sp.]|uniref:phenylacetate--CoA ligase family protein n=1 Tax=Marinobacter sp. TaxID=50741 RepID=UPI003566E416
MIGLKNEAFVKIAQGAIKNVPFYREWAREKGLNYRDIKSIEDLVLFPILEKKDIRSNPEKFVDERYERESDTFILFTSGTSGTPLKVFTNRVSRSKHYAFFSRIRSWYNLPIQPKRVSLFGRIIISPRISKPPFWRHDLFNNNLLMSSYHLNPKNIKYYVEKIRKYKPQEIFSYPSSIAQIAQYIIDNDEEPINIPLIMTTAEPLTELQRYLINRAFITKIVNQYGCTEMAFFASECCQGTMHVHPEHGIVEALEDNILGGKVLVATGFVNEVMPLIRYKVGDVIELSNSNCACGLPFPIIESLEGRIDDLIYLKDGTPIGRLDPIFKGGLGIREAQIIQNVDSSVDIFVVPDVSFSSLNRQTIIKEFNKRTQDQLKVKVITVKELARERNGKFKAVVGNYSPLQRK